MRELDLKLGDTTERGVSLALSKAEALVFFEFLSRFSDREKLDIVDQAEERVLWNIHCSLEKVLVEPFMADYSELVEKARNQIRDEE